MLLRLKPIVRKYYHLARINSIHLIEYVCYKNVHKCIAKRIEAFIKKIMKLLVKNDDDDDGHIL